MMNAIYAAQHSHIFIYRGWEVVSQGNPMTHAILRGYVNKDGSTTANYYYDDLVNLINLYFNNNFKNPAIIVDTNHSNSNKQYEKQIDIAMDVLHSMSINKDINNAVKGLMIESYLEDGCQKVDEGIYGKSITDPCLGWEKTEKLILDIANKLKKIR